MYFFNKKKIEFKNIQVIKVDQMIVFYNAMWSIIAHSCIRRCFVRWKPVNKGEGTSPQIAPKYKNEQLSTT